MAVCKCDSGLVNSGIPNCVTGFERIVKLFFVYQVANDGTSNGIPCNQTIDEAFLTEKLNEADSSKRWYPTGKISTVTEVRNDPTTETIDNVDFIVEKGSRTFNGFFVDTATSSPTYLKFLKSAECPSIMYFGVDVNGTIVGIESVEGVGLVDTLQGLKIQQKSMFSRPVPATSTTIAKNELTFTLDQLVLDENIAFISAAEITADLLNANGLLDVTLDDLSSSVTELVIEAKLVYGSLCNKLPFSGADAVLDWSLFNITEGLSVPITTIVEDPAGTYTISYSAQTALDEVRLTLAKDGYSATVLETVV